MPKILEAAAGSAAPAPEVNGHANEAAPKKPARKSKKPAPDAGTERGRKVLYPDLSVDRCDGEHALTAEMMKKLLGWYEEPKPGAFKDEDVLLEFGPEGSRVKVQCLNNNRNRQFDPPLAKKYCQTILNRQWADSRNGQPGEYTMNGETFVFGRTGECLSGQHRGIGLIMAVWEWEHGKESEHWKELWPDGPPTIETLIVKGVSEHPNVVMTIDNGRTRTGADVFFTNPDLFAGRPDAERAGLCRSLNFVIKATLWNRTGYGSDALNPYQQIQTNAGLADFLARHPRVEECVKFITEEDKGVSGGALRGRYHLPVGDLAALLYLFGASETDPAVYTPTAGEKAIDWKAWDRACEFFVTLAAGGDDFAKKVKYARRPAVGDKKNDWSGYVFVKEGGGNRGEKAAVLIKAFNAFMAEEPITDATLRLRYHVVYTDDGFVSDEFSATESPTVGGIDRGEEVAANEAEEPEVTPEEVEARKLEERKRKEEAGRTFRADPNRPPATPDADRKALVALTNEMKEAYPGKVVLYLSEAEGEYVAWGNDAEFVAKLAKAKPLPSPKYQMNRFRFLKGKEADAMFKVMKKAKAKVVVCKTDGGVNEVTEL